MFDFYQTSVFYVHYTLYDTRKPYYGLVKLAKLIDDYGESNPGPETIKIYAIQKVLQATHHQKNPKYQEYIGQQCTANAYITIIHSAIKNIGIWKSFDPDYILEHGNTIFHDVCEKADVIQPFAVDQLLLHIPVEDIYVSTNRLANQSNLYVEKNNFFENC